MSELQGVIVGQAGRKGNLQITGVVDFRQGSEYGVEVALLVCRGLSFFQSQDTGSHPLERNPQSWRSDEMFRWR